jgi:peptidoglycan-N-acetylglucosamine deacetylase
MRKIPMILLSAVFTLLLLPVAASDTPVVVLNITEGAVNGGLPATVILTADHPMSADTEILFTDSDGNAYTAVITGGQTETTVSVQTPAVSKRTLFSFTLSQGEGYAIGVSDEITLYPLPKVEFCQPIYVRKAENDCLITMTLKKNNLLEDGVFELRDQTGEVLATHTVKKDSKPAQFYFEWTPDASQKGRHDLSVWYKGLKVSADDGYLAMAGGEKLVVTHYDVTEKFIALSLDCAYQWAFIDDFLEMLDRQGVKVTFFITGFGVEAEPDAVLRILEHGHELGNHSYWHYHLDQIDNLLTVRREIRSVNELIETLTGVRPTKFRPPYGGYNKYLSAISRAEGCEVIMWTNDARDWAEGATADSIYHCIIRDPAPGNIILAHILNKDTVEALDKAITYFKEQGYRLGTVSELEALHEAETGKDHEP